MVGLVGEVRGRHVIVVRCRQGFAVYDHLIFVNLYASPCPVVVHADRSVSMPHSPPSHLGACVPVSLTNVVISAGPSPLVLSLFSLF